jgi:hypothetical protein
MALVEAQVQSWLDRYISAWRSHDPDEIAALWTAGATYAYQPWGAPVTGRSAIVADWIEEAEPPDSWEAAYAPLMIQGDRAVAAGETWYRDRDVRYSNLFLLRFDGDRCAELVEWYMKHPTSGNDDS